MALLAGRGKGAAVLLDDPSGTGETDPGTWDAARVAASLETPEEMGHIRWRDADAVIRDAEERMVLAVLCFIADGIDDDFVTVRAEFDSVPQQVSENPP